MHMFLERYISSHVGNQVSKAMDAFIGVLEGIGEKKMAGLLSRGKLILDTFQGRTLPSADDADKYAFYEERAGVILDDYLGTNLRLGNKKGAFIFPTGYDAGGQGHMIAALFEHEEGSESDHELVRVTYSNSGEGVDLINYHDHLSNDLFEICVSRVVTWEKAISMLKHMLYQKKPRRHLDHPGEEEKHGYTVFDSSAAFYGKVVGVLPEDPTEEAGPLTYFHEKNIDVTRGIFRTSRMHKGSKMPIIYARAQITGTCTYHSIMWLLFRQHLCVHGWDGTEKVKAAEELEQRMRKYVFARILPPTTSEERACYRLIDEDYSHTYNSAPGLGSELPPPPTSPPPAPTLSVLSEVNTLGKERPPYVYRGPEFLALAQKHFSQCSKKTDQAHLYLGVDRLLDDLRAVLQFVPEEERSGACGSHYTTTFLNLAQSAVLHAMEGLLQWDSVAIKTQFKTQNLENKIDFIVRLADAVLLVHPLFEGKDRVKIASENYWTEAYHRRYRRSVLRMCLLVISLQAELPVECREGARHDNASAVPPSYFYDDTISGDEAAGLMQYVHYAWPVAQKSPFWTDFTSRVKGSKYAFEASMIRTGEGAGIKKLADLRELVTTRPVGYALVILMTLLASQRMETDATHYRHFHISIRAEYLQFCEDETVFMYIREGLVMPELYMNKGSQSIPDRPPHAQSSSLQLAMEDAAAVLVGGHANSVITDLQLPRLLAADLGRAGLADDRKHIVGGGTTSLVNFHAGSLPAWREIRTKVVKGLSGQVPTMHDPSLAYFLVHATAVGNMRFPTSTFRNPGNTPPDSFASIARLLLKCMFSVVAQSYTSGQEGTKTMGRLLAYAVRHQAAMHIFGDSKVPWSAECADSGGEGAGGDRDAAMREYVLCRLILDWLVTREEVWTVAAGHLFPKDVLAQLTCTNQKSCAPWSTLEVNCKSYTLPVWFAPRWQSDANHIVGVPAESQYTYQIRIESGVAILQREDIRAREKVSLLVADCRAAPQVQALVDQLRNGGFRCCVWADIDGGSVEIAFADSPAPARQGTLYCSTKPSLLVLKEDASFQFPVSPWMLTWEGRRYLLFPEAEVPGPLLEWGRPYTGGTVFWVRDAQVSTTTPSLLVLTSGVVAVDLYKSVFNRRVANEALTLPRRTFLVPMHPNGRLPHLQKCAEDDMLVLFALCQVSCKDQCLLYLVWYIGSLGCPASSPPLTFRDKILAMCLTKHLAHPYRHVIHGLYAGFHFMRKEIESRSLLDIVLSPLSDRFRTQDRVTMEGRELTALVEKRLVYQADAGPRLITPQDPGVVHLDGDESMAEGGHHDIHLSHKVELANVRKVIANRDRRAAAGKSLFPPAYEPVDFYTMWSGKMWDAYERTREMKQIDLAEMVLGRVHSQWVPTLRENLGAEIFRGLEDMGIYQIAQGVIVNREQLKLLQTMTQRGKSKIFQATMGMGKSSVLMPYLVFRGLRNNDIQRIFIVQPEHLVADAVRMVRGLLGSLGGFFGPSKSDRAVLVTRIDEERRPSLSEHKLVFVLSDTAMKEYLVGTMVTERSPGNLPIHTLRRYSSMVIYDEIDGMYAPQTSEFNIPHADFKFHPLATPEVSWPTLYGKAIMDTVLGRTPAVPGLDDEKLVEKLRMNFAELRTRWSLNYQYGRSGSPTGLLAVPYKAAQTPMDRSSFSDIDVTALLTASMLHEEGLLARDFDLLKQTLVTSWVRSFPEVSAEILDDLFRITVADCSLSSLLRTPSAVLAAEGGFSRNARLIDFYVTGPLLQTHLRYFPRRYNLSFMDLLNIGSWQIGFSGTVNMVLPETSLSADGTRLIPHEFCEIVESAETGTLIQKAIEAGQCFVPDEGEPMETACVRVLVAKKYGALIDACAMWRNRSADGVYRMLVEGGVLARDAYRFVWLDDRDRALERVSKGGKEVVRAYRPEEALACAIPTFYYFDQRHSRGTDLMLPANVQALVTVEVGRSTLTDVAQAAFRLRRILRGQQAHFLLSGPVPGAKTTLYERLGHNGEAEKKEAMHRHHVQAYKAAFRWIQHEGWTKPMSRTEFERAYLENTPYALSPPVPLPSLEFSWATDIGERAQHNNLLGTLQGKAQGRDVPGPGHMQVQMERERETKQQRDHVAHPSDCLPNEARGDSDLTTYTEMGSADFLSQAQADARALGVILSPLITSNQEGIFGRVYMLNHTKKKDTPVQTTIMTREESLALPPDHQRRVVHVHMDRMLKEASAADLLGHLLCGCSLDLADQLRVLVDVGSDPAKTKALRGLLECFHKSRLVDLPEGQILRTFIRSGDPVNIPYMLQKFREEHLGSPESAILYLYRSKSVADFLLDRAGGEQVAGAELVRERIWASLRPLLEELKVEGICGGAAAPRVHSKKGRVPPGSDGLSGDGPKRQKVSVTKGDDVTMGTDREYFSCSRCHCRRKHVTEVSRK